jgi:flagellar biosynthesis chaperone FliJ
MSTRLESSAATMYRVRDVRAELARNEKSRAFDSLQVAERKLEVALREQRLAIDSGIALETRLRDEVASGRFDPRVLALASEAKIIVLGWQQETVTRKAHVRESAQVVVDEAQHKLVHAERRLESAQTLKTEVLRIFREQSELRAESDLDEQRSGRASPRAPLQGAAVR